MWFIFHSLDKSTFKRKNEDTAFTWPGVTRCLKTQTLMEFPMKESRDKHTIATGSALKTGDEMQTLSYTAAGFSSSIPLQMK